MFFPEASLWSQNTINDNHFTYDRRNVNLEVTANKKTLEKTEHFDLSAHLTLDFMSKCIFVLMIFFMNIQVEWFMFPGLQDILRMT